MADDIVRAMRPLIDYLDPTDIPLSEYLDVSELEPGGLIDTILVADAWTQLGPEGFQLGAEFHLGGLKDLHLPGLDQFKLSFNEDGFATGLLVLGEEPSLTIEELEITLTLDERIMRARGGGGAKIEATCGLRFDSNGFHFLTLSKASIADALVAGTDIAISLSDITLAPGADDWLSVGAASVTLPDFKDEGGKALTLNGSDIRIGHDGPSGAFERAQGPALAFSIGDFHGELERASVRLERGQLVSVDLAGRIDLGKFLEGCEDGWVSVVFSVGPEGLVAALSDDEPIIEMTVEDLLSLSVDTIRLETDGAGREATLWLSGALTPQIDGAEGGWPTIEFSGIGISPKGQLQLADGASIATTEPFSVDWNFLKLTVSAFRLERTAGTGDLELRLSAGVEILQGIPMGASVEGLVARRNKDGNVDVSFDGIGISFSTPGAFAVAASVAWDRDRKALSGTGHLDITALDIRLDVVFEASQEDGVTTLFVAAETDLMPGGVPIGTTGLCLYSISGLLAHNKAIKVVGTGPRRYFETFKQEPPGFASLAKWETRSGAHAMAIGVVIGTADDGWMFSTRGALLLSIPDMAILVTASAQLLEERPAMAQAGSAKLLAMLAVLPAEQLLRLDFEAEWLEPPLFEVQAAGGGEFHFGSPLDWRVWLGEHPDRGRPVSARVISVGDDWLLTADYWFGLAASRGANIGARASLALGAGSGGVRAEIVGSAEAHLDLAWKPSQLDGGVGLHARGRLAAGRVKISFTLSSTPSVTLDHPRKIEIPLEACVELDLGFRKLKLCLHYTFAWRNRDAPPLEAPIQGLQLVPRHWAPPPGHAGDDGIRGYRSDTTASPHALGMVAPHSELVLEFSKSMAVELPPNAPVKLHNDGKPAGRSVGARSGWWQRWAIAELELRDVTDDLQASLFGAFSRSPLDRADEAGATVEARPPNTELRLLSSRRFGQDGSLGGGGAEDTPPIDCHPCCSLAGLSTGAGRLPNGWAYEWHDGGYRPQDRDNRFGVRIAPEDSFVIYPPADIDLVDVTFRQHRPGQEPDVTTEQRLDYAGPYEGGLRLNDRTLVAMRLCWRRKTSADQGGATVGEEWTVPASERVLIPDHQYSLRVVTNGAMLDERNVAGPTMRIERTYEFKADRAPAWEGALAHAIAAVYPDDGRRPVYRGYDLVVRFKDDVFSILYPLDKRELAVQLRDANGALVEGPGGVVQLPLAWGGGPIERSPVETWWRNARHSNPGDGCEGGHEPAREGATVLPIRLQQLGLAACARYDVELIAVDQETRENATAPLARWSFTTSRFATFSEMAAPPPTVGEFGLIGTRSADPGDFNDLVRAFGAPAVAAAETLRIVPVRTGDSLGHLLIEAPEPLDDAVGRLSVIVDGQPTVLAGNLDHTRFVATLKMPIPLVEPLATVAVKFDWVAIPAGAAAEDRRTAAGQPPIETQTWTVPLKGIF